MSIETISTTTIQVFAPEPETFYPIDVAARLAQTQRHLILVCCKRGIISPHIEPESGRYFFDGATIEVLRRIEYLHTDCGINFTGVQIILSLADEVERFRQREEDSERMRSESF